MALSTQTITGILGNWPDRSRGQSKTYKKESDKASKQGSASRGENAQSKVQQHLPRTEEEYREIIHNKVEELYTKIKEGDTEVSYPIGGTSYTKKEWEKLLLKFDAIEEQIKKELEEFIEKKKEEEQRKEAEELAKERDEIIDKAAEEHITERELEALLAESTKVKIPSAQVGEEDKMYITWYTEEGIFCREQGRTEGYLWQIEFDRREQYENVIQFVKSLGEKDDISFAVREDFWRDYIGKNGQ